MYLLRVLSPWAWASAFPILKLDSTTITGSQEWVNSEMARYASMGWTIIDSGPLADYHADPYGMIYTPIPNGFHTEPPTTQFDFSSGLKRSTDFVAIVPDGKTRKELSL